MFIYVSFLTMVLRKISAMDKYLNNGVMFEKAEAFYC